MCSKCLDIDLRVLKFRRFMAEPIDALTKERLTAAVVEMEATKADLHPESSPSLAR
jgi:hypothetical protein